MSIYCTYWWCKFKDRVERSDCNIVDVETEVFLQHPVGSDEDVVQIYSEDVWSGKKQMVLISARRFLEIADQIRRTYRMMDEVGIFTYKRLFKEFEEGLWGE